MRYRVKGATVILGPSRKDGTRRVYAVRLRDWSRVDRLLRATGLSTATDGDALFVRLPLADQRVFAFRERSSRTEASYKGRST